MAFDFSIKAYFGGDTSGLKNAISSANENINKFSEGIKRTGLRIGEGLGVGVLIGAFVRLGAEAVKNAQQMRDSFDAIGEPVDENTRRLANFGDQLDDIKKGSINAVGSVVGFFNGMGESLGSVINRMRGVTAEQEKAAMTSEETTKRVLATIAEARKKSLQENSPAALMALEKQLGEVQKANALANMTAAQKLSSLTTDQFHLYQKIANTKKNSAAHLTAEIELEKNREAIIQAQNALYKEQYSNELAKINNADQLAITNDEKAANILLRIKTLQEEQAKFSKDGNDYNAIGAQIDNERVNLEKQKRAFTAQSNLDLQSQVELSQLLLKSQYGLTQAEEDRVTVLQNQHRLKENEVTLDDLLKKGVDNLTPEETKKYDLLLAQNKALHDLIDKYNQLYPAVAAVADKTKAAADAAAAQAANIAQAAAAERDLNGQHFGAGRNAQTLEQASDQELQELVRRDRQAQKDEVNPALVKGRSAFSSTSIPIANMIASSQDAMEAANAERELATRNKLRTDVKTFGEAGARRMFQGDPLAFDRLLQQFTQKTTTDDQQLTELRKINTKLAGKFRNQ